MEEYIVSARKYRPTSFDTVIGQHALTTTLKNAVKSGKLAHAYLFCGPRGVGKTTCARIFAKAINCLSPTPDGEACGHCESCKASDEGRSYNIFELDAASNNGIDHIKQLMEQTRIPPQVGRYKVFIIDEVHMLSTSAFNAFLKTLEEPPAHVIFILATTEKQKILPTILSRCQIYDFERMSVANIIAHLKEVAAKEGISYDEESLALIAEKADGGMRDALSIFDQAASFCQGNITYDRVREDLNVLDIDNYFQLIDLALDNKVADMISLFNTVISNGFDPGNTILGLASHTRNIMLAKDPQTLPMLDMSEQQRQRYQQQAARCTPKFLYQALKIMNECDTTYKMSNNKRLLAEITLIRVGQITQPDDDEPAAGRSPKRLKSLFNKIIASQQIAAGQVAVAESAKRKTDAIPLHRTTAANDSATTQQTATTAQGAQQAKAKSQPTRLRLDDISVSIAGIINRQRATKVEEEIELPEETTEDNIFTDEELTREWVAMCNRMKRNGIAIAMRLRNLTPHITQYPEVEVVADNQILLEEMQQIRLRLQKTMRNSLHNNNITLSLRAAESHEVRRYYSPRELLDQLRQSNPAVETLCDKFKLVLDN
ncbi:MAG: DNA polymerase III subunit gamma/tau [Prevotella sp.]|nr:DNA polymerase III subunit gamma/tau [Prevotella sp.]